MDQTSQSPLDIEELRCLAGGGEVGVQHIARIFEVLAARVESLEHILEIAAGGLGRMGDAGAQLKEEMRVALASTHDDLEKRINSTLHEFEAQVANAKVKSETEALLAAREQETLNRESARAEQARKDREAAEAALREFSDGIQKQAASLLNYEVEQKKRIAELEKRINDLTATLQRLVSQIAQKQATLAQLET